MGYVQGAHANSGSSKIGSAEQVGFNDLVTLYNVQWKDQEKIKGIVIGEQQPPSESAQSLNTAFSGTFWGHVLDLWERSNKSRVPAKATRTTNEASGQEAKPSQELGAAVINLANQVDTSKCHKTDSPTASRFSDAVTPSWRFSDSAQIQRIYLTSISQKWKHTGGSFAETKPYSNYIVSAAEELEQQKLLSDCLGSGELIGLSSPDAEFSPSESGSEELALPARGSRYPHETAGPETLRRTELAKLHRSSGLGIQMTATPGYVTLPGYAVLLLPKQMKAEEK
ncbi:MAG: hypothetical protein Q9161_001767 [Pseudevernia consocians]